MEKEIFNPKDEQYKEVADLPPEHQEEFMDVKSGGFATREAIINVKKSEEMAHDKERKVEAKKERLIQEYPEISQEIPDLSVGARELLAARKITYTTTGTGIFWPKEEIAEECILEFIVKLPRINAYVVSLKEAIPTSKILKKLFEKFPKAEVIFSDTDEKDLIIDDKDLSELGLTLSYKSGAARVYHKIL